MPRPAAAASATCEAPAPQKRTPEQQQALLAMALEGNYWRPTCVNCGIEMIERTPRNGGSAFRGYSNQPRCKTTMAIRVEAINA